MFLHECFGKMTIPISVNHFLASLVRHDSFYDFSRRINLGSICPRSFFDQLKSIRISILDWGTSRFLALNTHPCIIRIIFQWFRTRFPILSYNFDARIILLNLDVILTLLEILNIFGKVKGNEEIVKNCLIKNYYVKVSEDVI